MAGKKDDDFAAQLRAQFGELSVNQSALSDIFDEEPVPLDVFVRDKKFLNLKHGLSSIQYDVVRHTERVYFDGWEQDDDSLWHYTPENDLYAKMGQEFDPYWAEPCRSVNFITVMWGKGAGKDMTSRISALRVAYLLMCLKSPQEYFGMPESDSLSMLNVAASAAQATRAYFKPMIAAVKRKGNWFDGKCKPTINAIEFFAPNGGLIEAISGNSETESQEGLNLILGVADETDAFKSRETARASGKREAANTVEGILNMMRSSGMSRFTTFKNVRISFPRYMGSPIMQLMDTGKKSIARLGDKSPHYTSGPYATWEVKPTAKKAHFAGEYEEDPIEAAAKYECRPAKASTPYFRNTVLTQEAFVPVTRAPITITGYRRDGSSWMPEYSFAPDFVPIQGAIYGMHGDLAINGDKAGISMAHTVRKIEFESEAEYYDEDGNDLGPSAGGTFVEMRPLIKVDFAIAFEANLGSVPPREIQLRWARQLAMELVKRGFSIYRYTFDGFQSVDNMQNLEARGIESFKISTDRTIEPYKVLRDLMYEGRVQIPEDEKLLNELLSLNQAFGKIDHPNHGSKDLSDAVACAVFNAVELGGEENISGERAFYSEATFDTGNLQGTDLPMGFDANMLFGGASYEVDPFGDRHIF